MFAVNYADMDVQFFKSALNVHESKWKQSWEWGMSSAKTGVREDFESWCLTMSVMPTFIRVVKFNVVSNVRRWMRIIAPEQRCAVLETRDSFVIPLAHAFSAS